MLKKHKRLIIITIAIIVIFAIYKFILSPWSYQTVTFDEGYVGHVELENLHNGMEIPIELEEDGDIHFYTETGLSGKAILEKKIDGVWTKVETSDRGTCYGFQVYTDKGSYRIKAGPFRNPYVEYRTLPRDRTPAYDKEKARLVKVNRSLSDWFTASEKQSHWYRIEVPEQQDTFLGFFASDNWKEFAFQVKVYDEAETLIYETELIEDLDPNEAPEADFQQTLPKGTYYIEISKSDPDSYGGYGLLYE